MNTILEVKNLVKSFPEVCAVDGVSFSIPRGICFGLLGPNGAGKTTTIEVIETILKHDSG
ncbi:MAG TPA: ATP-binding cassette domain-containing protein, partial [Spirochaetota bacterium]|nr:ATP-binding cassette domain-containing protein [Spirochaetota bacterium]